MAELTTKTGSDAAVEIKRIFGDEDGIEITDADIIRWINSGQRSIVAVNPILQRTITHDIVAGQADYTFPADRVQYIQALYYNGMPLEAYSYPEAQEHIMSADPDETTTGEPLLWFQWAQTITLFPKPEKAVPNGLRMDYVAIPVELMSITDALSLPDRYFDAIINFCLQKAHQVEENFDGAGYVKSIYTETLAQLSEQENKVSLRSYPTVTVRTEDL